MLRRRHHGFRLARSGFAIFLGLRTPGVHWPFLILQGGIPLTDEPNGPQSVCQVVVGPLEAMELPDGWGLGSSSEQPCADASVLVSDADTRKSGTDDRRSFGVAARTPLYRRRMRCPIPSLDRSKLLFPIGLKLETLLARGAVYGSLSGVYT